MNLTMADETNNPAERKAAIEVFGIAGQHPSSTPGPTVRCSGENLANPTGCQDRYLQTAQELTYNQSLLTRRLVIFRW